MTTISGYDATTGMLPADTRFAHYDGDGNLVGEIQHDGRGRFDAPVTVEAGEMIAMLLPGDPVGPRFLPLP